MNTVRSRGFRAPSLRSGPGMTEPVVSGATLSQTEQDGAPRRPSAHRLPESIVERICKLACVAALVVMLIVVATDILTRALFNFSFEISDELGGYLLVVIAFVSLPV